MWGMNRQTFLRALGAAGFGSVLSSCSVLNPEPSGRVSWPPAQFASVRAFVYSCEAERDVTFLRKDGSMHPGVLNAPGALLSPGQVTRLVDAITVFKARPKRTACYVPHHAFVFYDASGRPVACFEVCFTCHRHEATPDGLPSQVDYDVLWTIIHELGVAADTTKGYYKRLYDERNGGR
jgi:hypothetical protein